jgi:hypothetical protein
MFCFWEKDIKNRKQPLSLPTSTGHFVLSAYNIVSCIGGNVYYLPTMLTFILWLLLLVLCWPLALLALVLYPVVWLLLLPFRLVGIAVDGVFSLLKAVLTLPAKVLRMNR